MRTTTNWDNLRNSPLYSQTEAALYLGIPLSTLRYWAIGEARKTRSVQPIIQTPRSSSRLSFLNLIELHLLNSLRREYNIDLSKIRKSLNYVTKELSINRPLLHGKFETDGVDLFVDHYGALINVTSAGQQAMRDILTSSLKRIERDSHRIPVKLFPYTHSKLEDSPAIISMSPALFSGRPVIDGTGISTAVIADRLKAGDSPEVLAADYNQTVKTIMEAIRCELQPAA
jgi:uncharacterized protein (DUF433 family)